MATHPLVGVRDDLGPLVKLSLQSHDVPVTAVFDVFEESTNDRFIAIATPLVERQGPHAAYTKIFDALKDETFSTQTFLRLHTVVLSPEDVHEIRRALGKGATEASLPKLARLTDVLVHPRTIRKIF